MLLCTPACIQSLHVNLYLLDKQLQLENTAVGGISAFCKPGNTNETNANDLMCDVWMEGRKPSVSCSTAKTLSF